ncbi:hypothetical protein [Halegenticoccus soli]|nr:hypothetical protein [Halegenticoccus soli]
MHTVERARPRVAAICCLLVIVAPVALGVAGASAGGPGGKVGPF